MSSKFISKERVLHAVRTKTYERCIPLESYLFKSKKSLQSFIRNISLLVDNDANKINAEISIITNYATITVNNLEDIYIIIDEAESIYAIKLCLSSKLKMSNRIIELNFLELESFKKQSYLKLISNNKKWINRCEEDILHELSLNKNTFRFLKKSSIQAILIFLLTVISTVVIDKSIFFSTYNAYSFFSSMMLVLFSFIFVLATASIVAPTFRFKTFKAKKSVIYRIKMLFSLTRHAIFNYIIVAIVSSTLTWLSLLLRK